MKTTYPEPATFLRLDETQPAKVVGRKRKIVATVVLFSVIAHLIFGTGAAFWIVAQYMTKPAAVFQVRKPAVVPPQEREHRVSMESFDSMTPKPSVTDRISTPKPAKLSLPDLPQLPVNQMLTVNANPTFIPQMAEATSTTGQGTGGGTGSGSGMGKGTAFGFTRKTGGMLTGRFYDLKKLSSNRDSEITPGNYSDFLAQFITARWDQGLLEKYYRAPKTLYLSHVYIPLMEAEEAPEAYGVSGTVEPKCWVAHYKGSVSAPYTETIRFWGYSDDVMLVRLGGQIVLTAGRRDTVSRLEVPGETHETTGINTANGQLVKGPWYRVTKGKPIEMEVLIGERPGGYFCAFLAVERRGQPAKTPPADLDLFRLSGASVKVETDPAVLGPINDKAPVWTQGAPNTVGMSRLE